MTRAQNSFFNILTSLVTSALLPVLNFVTRMVFTRTLGMSYLGISGLFSNILTVLSLADLGFGVAISYMLYEPLEKGDVPRIQALMKLYRRIYHVVGTIIAAAGLCAIPLLPVLVKDYARFAELGLSAAGIFLIYLFGAASSYWLFSYKAALVQAAQKSYVLTIIGWAVSIANSLCQILALLLTKSFVVYLCVQTAFSILSNILGAVVCDRKYPFVREKSDAVISREERKEIFKNCYAVFFHRINGVVINASDTIVLSAFAGLDVVGLYSNYLAVKSSVRGILAVFTTSIQASLGSLMTEKNDDWSQLLFRAIHYVTFWIYGVGAIGIALLADEFVTLCFGAEYVVTSWNGAATPVALLIGIELYLSGHAYIFALFRETAGLFQPLRYRPILTILVNLVVSLVAVPRLGIAGCVVGTIAALLTTELLIDPIVVHRLALHRSPRGYVLRAALYGLLVAAAGLVCAQLCRLVALGGVVGFIVRGAICVLAPSGLFLLASFRTREFRFLMTTMRSVLRRP